MSVQERIRLSAVARRLFITAPEIVVDAVVGVAAGPSNDPKLLLGALPVGEATVIDALLGFTAPDDWLGIGVVAGDCAITPVDGEDSAHPDPDDLPSRVVYLLNRSGEGVTAVGLSENEPTMFEHPRAGARGHLVDVCHRSLGLPTPEPTTSTASLVTAIWLDRVADLVLGSDAWPGWSTIARLHPAVEPFEEIPGPERLRHLADVHVARTSWARARAQVTLGRIYVPGVDRDLAAWMDVGTFARWTERAFIHHLDLLGAMTARFGDLVQPIRFVADGTLNETHGDRFSLG